MQLNINLNPKQELSRQYQELFNKRPINVIIVSFAVIAFVLVLINTAWIGDDAYISFRTIDNFTNGYGLTWNLNERLQTFTDPGMMLLQVCSIV